jgi:hypothetical protein
MNPLHEIPLTQTRMGRGGRWALVGIWLLAELLPGAASAAPVAAVAAAPSPHKWASSLPSATSQRHVTTTLAYEELAGQVGERVLITTVYGDLRDVRIESYSNDEILVRVGVVGGYATQHIQRSQIRLIRDPD